MRKVKRRQTGKNAAWVGKLFHLVSPLSQFRGQPARTRLTAVAGTLALSAGTLMASAGSTPYRLVPAHFYPLIMTKVIAGVRSPGSFDKMQTERRVAANPQTKPVDLGCESAAHWLLPSTSTVAIVIITQPVSRYSFHRMQI